MTTSYSAATNKPRPSIGFARTVLRADGAVVAIGGALLLAAADPVGAFLGIAGSPGLRIAGALCVGYGGWLFWTADHYLPERLRGLVAAIAGGNTVWVLGSILVLLTDTPALTVGGRWAVAALAVVVALFAAAQVAARRQLRQ